MSEAVNAARSRALSLVGQGYIYGAKGQRCSPAFRAGQAKQYPEQAETILGVGAKWDGKPVWDCAQLTRTVAAAAGAELPSGATSQWNKAAWARKGSMDTLPAEELAFLYRRQSGSNAVMAHTGVCLGDGTCVHARGTACGVVRQDMDSYPWTHWASPWRISGERPKEEESVDTRQVIGGRLALRAAASASGAVLRWLPDGTCVQVLEETGAWCRVETGGETGWCMAQYLQKTAPAQDKVCISLPRADALRLLNALKAAT